jgi:DNA-nicking Smr family endonuclease
MRGVAPLPRDRMEEAEPRSAAPPSRRTASMPPTRVLRSAADLPELSAGAAPGLDRRSAERLRRGATRVEARLDLHGMTQAEAHAALVDFLLRAQTAGRRCVLVITGKGEANGGVLRSAVPRWLNEPANRARILAFASAQARDGGTGALYLLLRRRR